MSPWPPVPEPGTVPIAELPNDDVYAPCQSSRSVHRRYHRVRRSRRRFILRFLAGVS